MNKDLELYDNLTMCVDLVERISIIFDEILFDLLFPLDKEMKNGKTIPIKFIVESKAYRNRVKGEIVDRILDELASNLRDLAQKAEPTPVLPVREYKAEPISDADTAKSDRIDEILNQINIYVGLIENMPDWLDRMKALNHTAFSLALSGEYKQPTE